MPTDAYSSLLAVLLVPQCALRSSFVRRLHTLIYDILRISVQGKHRRQRHHTISCVSHLPMSYLLLWTVAASKAIVTKDVSTMTL